MLTETGLNKNDSRVRQRNNMSLGNATSVYDIINHRVNAALGVRCRLKVKVQTEMRVKIHAHVR